MKSLWAIALLAVGLFSACQEKTAQAPLISPPNPAWDIPFQTLEAHAEEEFQLTAPTGTVIDFPKNAFQDSLGNAVKGNVQVQYREFHDAVDALLAGIPMSFSDSTGKKAFKTAGMFELRASQGFNTLQLDPNKEVAVKFASYHEGENYPYFYLNEETRQWEKPEKEITITENPMKAKALKAAQRKRPRRHPLNPKITFVFNYMAFLDVEFNDAYAAIEENKDNEKLKKKFKSYGLSHFNIWANNRIEYNKREYPASMLIWEFADRGSTFPQWAESGYTLKTFTKVPNRRNTYHLHIKQYRGEKSMSCTLKAIMPLPHLMRFSPNYWKNNYNAAMAQVEAEAQKAREMVQVYRSISIAQLGIHNYDYFSNDEKKVQLMASFDWEGKQPESLENQAVRVYLVAENNQTVVEYRKGSWPKLKIAPLPDARFIAILPGNRLGVFSNSSFQKVPFDKLRFQLEPQWAFFLERSEMKIESAEDLKNALGMKPRLML